MSNLIPASLIIFFMFYLLLLQFDTDVQSALLIALSPAATLSRRRVQVARNVHIFERRQTNKPADAIRKTRSYFSYSRSSPTGY